MIPGRLGHGFSLSSRRETVTLFAAVLFLGGCGGGTNLPGDRNNLNDMQRTRISIGANQFEVWLAMTEAEQQLGLMQVKQEELSSFREKSAAGLSDINRGMLFVFEYERPLSFWMYNTITALDIAYIREDGQIVGIYTMAPLETRVYPSGEPARTALEVKAGLFAALGIKVGDHVEIPASVLKGVR
jgi:uncharacterized membrane protein (UPF0127 family)